jgi:phage tail-like protein
MTRHERISLLPPTASAVETALSLVSAEHRELIPWDDLPKVFDPAQCPARLLPWLATVFSVDVWFDEWSEQRKRDVIANSIRLHRLKGTLAGIEEYAALVDARIVEAVTPPSLFFASDFSDEHFAAWMQRLPELRIYQWTEDSADDIAGALTFSDLPLDTPDETPFDGEAVEQFLAFIDGEFDDEDGPACFCLFSPDYPAATGRKAVLIENGQTIDLEIEDSDVADARGVVISGAERVFFPENAGLGLYLTEIDPDLVDGQEVLEDIAALDDPVDGSFLHDGTDKNYVAYVRKGGQRLTDIGAPSIRGRAVQDSSPIRVYVDGGAVGGWFLDDPFEEAFAAVASDVLFSFYDSWRIVDPRVPATHGPAWSFMDYDVFGIPAYEADLTIDMVETGVFDSWFLDAGPIGFLVESGYEALWNLCDVVVVASSERDRIGLDLSYEGRKSLRRLYQMSELLLR